MLNYIDLRRLDSIPDISFDLNNPPNYVKSFNPILSDSTKFEIKCDIDGDALAKITGIDTVLGKAFTVNYEGMIPVQIKKHRKKRINKKWAKRYGYKMVPKHVRMINYTVKDKIDNDILNLIIEGQPSYVI